MPWLTPDSIPEGDDCRPLSIPASSVWLALVSGALTELTKPYNWQKFGTLTVQETVDRMQQIVDTYYDTPCAVCETPGGYRVVRISPSGHPQQLDGTGSWVPTTDDYAIPAPEARTGGTALDQKCLAAKNAVNVLQQLYENLSDSFSSELSTAEAETAFIAALIALVGFEFAPISWAVVAFFEVVFELVYKALEFLTADLWDTAVSEQITCFLLECASNDAGVVTFDYECFTGKLNSLTDTFSLTENQLRLYLQIAYMLYFIGGVDGLNLAGATTAITDDDCTDCDLEWCFLFDFTLTDGSAYNWAMDTASGTWVSGSGWQGTFFDANSHNTVVMTLAEGILDWSQVNLIRLQYTKTDGAGGNNANILQSGVSGVGWTTTNVLNVNATHGTKDLNPPAQPFDVVYAGLNSGTADTTVIIEKIWFFGTGECPFGDPNC